MHPAHPSIHIQEQQNNRTSEPVGGGEKRLPFRRVRRHHSCGCVMGSGDHGVLLDSGSVAPRQPWLPHGNCTILPPGRRECSHNVRSTRANQGKSSSSSQWRCAVDERVRGVGFRHRRRSCLGLVLKHLGSVPFAQAGRRTRQRSVRVRPPPPNESGLAHTGPARMTPSRAAAYTEPADGRRLP